MDGWSPVDLLPGLYLALLGGGLAAALRRWYDPVPPRILAVFALVLVVLFGQVLFSGGVLLPLGNLRIGPPFAHLEPPDPPTLAIQGDLVHQIAPWSLEVRRALRDGRWPLWNARAGAGMPLLADPQSQAFQPIVAAAYPFPIWPAVGITAALRVLLALVFFFLLLRRQGLGEPAALAGSLAFGLGGFLLLWLGWPMANSAALLPVALYAVVRCDESGRARDLLLLFLAVASLLLGGHPETITYSLTFTGLFLLDRVRRRGRAGGGRLLVRSGATMALSGALVAPVLLPILDYLPKTNRGTVVEYQLAPRPLGALWSELGQPETLAAWRERVFQRLLPVAAPRAFGDHNYYRERANVIEEASGFVGQAALLTAAVALLPLGARRRFPQERLAGLGLAACLLLLAQPPGFDNLWGRLPIVGATAIHLHHRTLIILSFCLAYLAACEIERRGRGEGSRWPVAVAAMALAALVSWGYLAHPQEILAVQRGWWLAAHLATLAVAAALLTLRHGGRQVRALPWVFCVLVAAELLLLHRPALPPAPRRLAYPETPPVRFLQENLGDQRMVGIGSYVYPANFPQVNGLNDVRIDNPSLPMAYSQVLWLVQSKESPSTFLLPKHAVYDLLGVRYVMTRPEDRLRLEPVFRDPAGWIWERPRALPRLFLPARAVAYEGGSWPDWLARNSDFLRRSLVAEIPGGRKAWRVRRPRASHLDLSIPDPAHVQGHAVLAERRLLASNTFQDGHWGLLLNRERRPATLANGPFVAAWLPAGTWRIDLLYRPLVFVAGCVLSALAIAAALVWWVPRPRDTVSSLS
ncbi:MAG TPA: hypothetical protein VE685_13880 [Thermoanaerobaculia bacterium]|nr:hypothetical protein [Thermoanaerobaculia bacterium]